MLFPSVAIAIVYTDVYDILSCERKQNDQFQNNQNKQSNPPTIFRFYKLYIFLKHESAYRDEMRA